jgi:hypothetical protein
VTNLNAQKLEDIDQAITNYKALKLKVAISELDLRWQAPGADNWDKASAAKPPPTPEARRTSRCLRQLFALFRNIAMPSIGSHSGTQR